MDINNKEYFIFNDLSPKMFTFLPKYIYNWEKEYLTWEKRSRKYAEV